MDSLVILVFILFALFSFTSFMQKPEKVVLGSKLFNEPYILAHMIAVLLDIDFTFIKRTFTLEK